ncbi:acetoacetate decarboxylase family protein [Falsihalocynthiibacter sp. S25ZX9]|uniref:acetoacetate decarboxylase family protein n=1 Tax=Falsihalocynthiibacter sp. S25ZX9 TaxID=3240870 RepID=UPI00350F31A0
MFTGFTPPYSDTGKSSLVTAPPWHYAGRVMSFAVDVDKEASARFLPEGFGKPTGRAFGHFCEWQATTDGSELLDPAYALYDEFFYLLEAEHEGQKRLFCPFIYVTQDISMVRGLLQGWPKKMASVRIARSYDLDHPAAGKIQKDTRLGATVAVKDRRLAEAELRLTGEISEPIGFLATPTLGLVGHPTLIGGPDSGSHRLVRQDVSEKLVGDVYGATGELRVLPAPRDELSDIAPLRTTEATLCALALTVVGVQEVQL